MKKRKEPIEEEDQDELDHDNNYKSMNKKYITEVMINDLESLSFSDDRKPDARRRSSSFVAKKAMSNLQLKSKPQISNADWIPATDPDMTPKNTASVFRMKTRRSSFATASSPLRSSVSMEDDKIVPNVEMIDDSNNSSMALVHQRPKAARNLYVESFRNIYTHRTPIQTRQSVHIPSRLMTQLNVMSSPAHNTSGKELILYKPISPYGMQITTPNSDTSSKEGSPQASPGSDVSEGSFIMEIE